MELIRSEAARTLIKAQRPEFFTKRVYEGV